MPFCRGIVFLVCQELILYGLRSGSLCSDLNTALPTPTVCDTALLAVVANYRKIDQIQYGKRSLLKILYIRGLTTEF